MLFNNDDLSRYNTAHSPWYQVSPNGKVDIGVEQGFVQKVGLSSEGMFKLVNEWLTTSGLSTEQKQQLKEKLK